MDTDTQYHHHHQQSILNTLKRLNITSSRANRASRQELRFWTPSQVIEAFDTLPRDWTVSGPIGPVLRPGLRKRKYRLMLFASIKLLYNTLRLVAKSTWSLVTGRVGEVRSLVSGYWAEQKIAIAEFRYIKAPLKQIRLAARERRALCVNRAGRFSIRSSGYVVCSYVFSELLGYSGPEDAIPFTSSLNIAHFERIFETVSRAGCEWMWIDMLAFPVDEGDMESKTLVLNSFADVVRNADKLVVLDALALQMIAVDEGQAAAALVCGSWMGRVASYTEAVLAREVVVLMAGRSEIRFSALVHSLMQKAQQDPLRYKALYEKFRRLRPGSQGISLLDIVRECVDRTSPASPESALEIFPALGMRWHSQFGPIEGMMEIVRSQPDQAARLAAMRGPRGLPAPYGWAPASLVGLEGLPRDDVEVLDSGELEGKWTAARAIEIAQLFRDWDSETIIVLSVAVEGNKVDPIQEIHVKLSTKVGLRRIKHLKIEADVEIRNMLEVWREDVGRRRAWVIWGKESPKDVLLVVGGDEEKAGGRWSGRVIASGAVSEEIAGGETRMWILS
jgi:hypothetical protein